MTWQSSTPFSRLYKASLIRRRWPCSGPLPRATWPDNHTSPSLYQTISGLRTVPSAASQAGALVLLGPIGLIDSGQSAWQRRVQLPGSHVHVSCHKGADRPAKRSLDLDLLVLPYYAGYKELPA